MNNLEKLTKIIHESDPSILELKFGCEIKKGIVRGLYIYELDDFVYTTNGSHPKNDLEILGRPINLEDVLKAIGNIDRFNPKNTSRFLNIDTNGEFCWTETKTMQGGDMEIIEPTISWQLGKPLDQQSQETIDFLLSILDKTK